MDSPVKIEINEKFSSALDIMNKTSKNLLVTGRAGTGKSTLLEHFVRHAKKEVVVLAPTGVAAVNIRGQTIHSFFGFKPTITLDKIKTLYANKIYKIIDTIIIDEISMVRADLLDCVDKFLRLNGKSKNKPFGGIQMIFIGDPYQLPPVVIGREREVFRSYYKSPYFFDARSFNDIEMEFIELEKIYRQTDENFISLLNAIRNKSATADDMKEINKRLAPDFEPDSNELYIHLTTTNALADEINAKELGKIKSELFTFKGKLTGSFDSSHLPTDEELNLKVNSQVMLLNNDLSHRWINGTVGKIIDIIKDKKAVVIKVMLTDGKIVDVFQHKWDLSQVVYNEQSKKLDSEIIGSFTQYPIRLAWAVTIHKGQGKTFEKVIIDIGKGTFTYGQMYVALSRCTSLQGIILKKPLNLNHIWLDWRVVNFLTKYQYNISEKK